MNGFLTPVEILNTVVEKGAEKVNAGARKLWILSFLGGMYISLGFLACLRASGSIQGDLAGLGSVIGAGLFPIGLIAILIGGGELVTGNMLVVGAAFFCRTVPASRLARNWIIVTIGNLLGAIATAWVLGHLTGLTEGAMLGKIAATAAAKVDGSYSAAFFSGIGCNIFVGLAVWLSFAAKDIAGKILAIWLPITAFVVIGFQHVVANMFVIPAAIFSGQSEITWAQFFVNFGIVWLGNMVGAAIVLGLLYSLCYWDPQKKTTAAVGAKKH